MPPPRPPGTCLAACFLGWCRCSGAHGLRELFTLRTRPHCTGDQYFEPDTPAVRSFKQRHRPAGVRPPGGGARHSTSAVFATTEQGSRTSIRPRQTWHTRHRLEPSRTGRAMPWAQQPSFRWIIRPPRWRPPWHAPRHWPSPRTGCTPRPPPAPDARRHHPTTRQ